MASNPEKIRHQAKRTNLKYLYGLTLEDYNAMVFQQSGLCKCCRSLASDLVVDHDHTTHKVRGLLCSDCNKALGFIHESVARAEALIGYLICANP